MVDTVLVSSPGSATLYYLPKPIFFKIDTECTRALPKVVHSNMPNCFEYKQRSSFSNIFYGTTRLLWKTLTLLITLSDKSFLFSAYPGVYLLFHFTSVSE